MNGGKGLDNIVLRTEWFDKTEKFCEIRLDCKTKYLTIYQICYIFEEEMNKVYIAMDEYIKNSHQTKKIIFGDEREGGSGYFSFLLTPINLKEELKIEVDMEIADNDKGLHRCKFYVNTQLESFKYFRNNLPRIFSKNSDREIKLHPYF
ncbi:hypothetical protein [Streptococcus oralis]|uniref:hypothetical protein n=1 Tax=Streptococcus oralis TaxID=1303 RepID=UPI0022852067|nr:hypothetical protein [Streptococcus oralis]MCY7103384.1 hypothetical protein [Streptococcus oralis]